MTVRPRHLTKNLESYYETVRVEKSDKGKIKESSWYDIHHYCDATPAQTHGCTINIYSLQLYIAICKFPSHCLKKVGS